MKELASKKNNFHYNKKLKEFSRENRTSMSKAAASVWKNILSRQQMMGYKFRRERPILNYIADFACLELLLIIEVDGFTHDDDVQLSKDKIRDQELAEVGFKTLRYSSWEVLNRINDVSKSIAKWIEENPTSPPPNPRQRGTN